MERTTTFLWLAIYLLVLLASFSEIEGYDKEKHVSAPILRTCSELKSVGYIENGVYKIDPDGPRMGVDPFVVYCDLSTEFGTSVVLHDQFLRTRVPDGFEYYGSYVVPITYEGASIDQMAVLADTSLTCSQYISIECRGVSIWSMSQVGTFIQWWVSRNGTIMPNWGSPTGTRGCSCSVNDTCDNGVSQCNCDNNDAIWRQDDGFLNDKSQLPVTVMQFGDNGLPDEQSHYKLGPFQCSGMEPPEVCTRVTWDGISFQNEPEGLFCPLEIRYSQLSENDAMRIEVLCNGTWTPLCSSRWTLSAASIVCKELGFPEADAAPVFKDEDKRCVDDLWCNGDEEYLAACEFSKPSLANEGHLQAVGVVCGNKVRLLDGDDADNEGRVEVFLDFTWKPLCVASWDIQNADAICKSLQYEYAIAAMWQNVPLDFYDSKYYVDLNCHMGNETSVSECLFEKIYFATCDAAAERGAAAVICSDDRKMYITASSNDSYMDVNSTSVVILSWISETSGFTEHKWSFRCSNEQIIKFMMWAYYLTTSTLTFEESSPKLLVSIEWTLLIRAIYSVSTNPMLSITGDHTTSTKEGFHINVVALHESTTTSCGANSFACFSGVCISNHGVCNGIQNCPDNSDERYCHDTSDECPSILPSNISGKCYLPISLPPKSPDSLAQITYSTNASMDLYLGIPEGVWKPEKSDQHPFLEITFSEVMLVSCVIVEGHWSIRPNWRWVDAFELTYSYAGEDWKVHTATSDSVGNPSCVSIIKLSPQVKARFLRFYPSRELTERGILGVKIVQILGCRDTDCDYAVGISDINNQDIQIASNQNITKTILAPVLWGSLSPVGWTPQSSHDWIRIDLDQVYMIHGMVTQGCCSLQAWVISYCLQYVNADNIEAIYGEDSSICKSLAGNTGCYGLSRNRFTGGIQTNSMRLYNFNWSTSPCLKIELQGCPYEIPSCQIGHSAACDHTHVCTFHHARIASIGYPDPYFQRSTCTWTLITDPGSFIFLTFLLFDIPSLGQCDSSSLEIYNAKTDEYYSLLGIFCNTQYPPGLIRSNFNFLHLKFLSGAEEPGKGFEGEYRQDRSGNFNESGKQTDGACPVDWTFFKGNCYKVFIFDHFIRWKAAEETCRDHDSHLVSVKDYKDMEFLHSLLLMHVEHQTNTYIGLILGKDSSTHTWIDGRPLSYSDWFAPKSPDVWVHRQPDGGRLESCSLIKLTNFHSTNHWHDVPCAAENNANQGVCMKPASDSCPTNMKQCPNFECVHTIHKCVGPNDVELDIDSVFVPIPPRGECNIGEMQCALSGECIRISFMCDFIAHCQDGSDEETCEYRRCQTDEHTCSNEQCIPKEKQCDLIIDCLSTSDEQDCDTFSAGYQCYDGSLIPEHAYCDDQRDCAGKNWEDEPQTCDVYNNFTCLRLSCKNGACVEQYHRCMYSIDAYGFMKGCRDATHLDDCEKFDCPEKTLKCPGSYCIPLQYRCDGKLDCPNGEDELKCDNFECPGSYRCYGSLNCIDQSQVCDEVRDCIGGDDEWFCDVSCPRGCECIGYFLYCNRADILEKEVAQLSRNTKEIHMVNMEGNVIQPLLLNHIKDLVSLIVLNLTGNGITELNKSPFAGNTNLFTLSVANNHLTYLNNATLRGLSNLRYLDISGNPLIKLDPGIFSHTKSLQFLVMVEIWDQIGAELVFSDLTSLKSLHSNKYVYCCIIQNLKTVTECLPEADQFSSCEDLIRVKVLRVFIWLLGISAVIGNMFVIVTRFKSSRDGSLQSEAARVQALIVSHLAIADCLMGVYMLIVAIADAYYRNRYAQFAEEWQTSFTCKFAGFLSMLSSEASVFFMFAISVDRFLRIVFPFGRMKMKPIIAKLVIATAWFLTGLISLIPVLAKGYFGDEFYGRSTVCLALPLTFDRPAGWQYSVAIFLFVNLFAFIGMSFCYAGIYISVKFASKRLRQRNKSRAEESQLALRMAFVVLSDLCCWMPIITLGFLSLRGTVAVPPIIYAWTAVFILPLNSSLNPYIYTFLTRSKAKVSPADATAMSTVTKHNETQRIADKGASDVLGHLQELHAELKSKHLLITTLPTNQDFISLSDYKESNGGLGSHEIETIRRHLTDAIEALHDSNQLCGQINQDRVLLTQCEDGTIQVYLAFPYERNEHATTSSTDSINLASDSIGFKKDFENLRNFINEIENQQL